MAGRHPGRTVEPSLVIEMTSLFQTQDLIEETSLASVHRAVGKDGSALYFTQTRLEPEVREALMKPGVFEGALAKLRSLEFEYLRAVMDAGMAESGPWVTSQWLDAKPLSECSASEQDLQNLAKQLEDLLMYLGECAGVVDLNEKHILTMRGEDGRLACLFQIDYSRWFSDCAAGGVPGGDRSAGSEARELIKGLAIRQLKLPKVVRKKDPIPFVDERSPALTSYPSYREPWLGRVMFWGTLIVGLLVIGWFTVT